ncbi:hypothetical protein KM043_006220 [Ampulex compressa]|nr:hypothetical protein KM043_006220 [Ampulex compressa]
MSEAAKEDAGKASQEKKSKKKKASKSAEQKVKEPVEEPTVNEAVAKEPVEEEKIPNSEQEPTVDSEEVPADAKEVEENVSAEVPEKVADEPVKKAPARPESPPAVASNYDEERKKKMDMEKLIELKEAFSLFDFNHDGIIDMEDLKFTFASMGKPNMPEEQLKQMLGETSDPVDFDAFVTLFGFKVTSMDTEEEFTAALAKWDWKGTGMISEERLKGDLLKFGDRFSVKEVDCALEEAPVYVQEGVPMIDYIKFSSNICGFRNVEKSRQEQKSAENA